MTFFAAMLPHIGHTELLALQWAFMLFALVSFLRVAGYVTAQLRTGQFFGSENAPLPFLGSEISGWLLIFSVMALLFVRSEFYMIMVVIGVGILMVANGCTWGEQFGLRRLPASKIIMWSLLTCGAIVFVETPLTVIVEKAMDAIHLPHPEQQSVEMFRQLDQPAEILLFMLQAVMISPLIEELFFRGFLLTFLKNYTTSPGAIFFSAAIFALAHANIDSAIPLWFLGIVLGVAYQHTGSLLLPVGIHACWNFFTAMGLILEKGNG